MSASPVFPIHMPGLEAVCLAPTLSIGSQSRAGRSRLRESREREASRLAAPSAWLRKLFLALDGLPESPSRVGDPPHRRGVQGNDAAGPSNAAPSAGRGPKRRTPGDTNPIYWGSEAYGRSRFDRIGATVSAGPSNAAPGAGRGPMRLLLRSLEICVQLRSLEFAYLASHPKTRPRRGSIE